MRQPAPKVAPVWLTALLTSAAMVAFAANFLLARGALGGKAIGAADETLLRLVSGAVAKAALLASQDGFAAHRLPGAGLPTGLGMGLSGGLGLARCRQRD